MPLIKLLVAPFRGLFVGNAEDTGLLRVVTALRTNGATVTEDQELEYCQDADEVDPVGLYTSTATITVVTGTPDTNRLARGLSMSESDLNRLPGRQLYTLCFLHPDPVAVHSYVFLKCWTVRKRTTTYGKKGVTAYEIQFVTKTKDAPDRYFQGTQADCKTFLGARSPF